MNILQFMGDSPILTFCLVYMLTWTLVRLWCRLTRVLMVRKHGWPPAHLDADGDWKPEPEKESQ